MLFNLFIFFAWMILELPGAAVNIENIKLAFGVVMGVTNFCVTFAVISTARRVNESKIFHRFRMVFGGLIFLLLGLFSGNLFADFGAKLLTKIYAQDKFSSRWICVTSNYNRYSGSINVLKDQDGNEIKLTGYDAFCPVGALGIKETYILSGREWAYGKFVEEVRAVNDGG